jgi:hypothetical protein
MINRSSYVWVSLRTPLSAARSKPRNATRLNRVRSSSLVRRGDLPKTKHRKPMTTLQQKALKQAIDIINEAQRGVREMERKAREIERQIGAMMRSAGDTPHLADLHINAGRVVDSQHGDKLNLAIDWIKALNESA